MTAPARITQDDIAAIAKGLTKAQRDMLLTKFNPGLTGGRLSRLWKNLRKRGLSDGPHRGLNPLGLSVRAYLMENGDETLVDSTR